MTASSPTTAPATIPHRNPPPLPLIDNASTSAETAAAKYHHPYTPYDVQMQFMKTVYDVCEQGDGHVGILESPTGTGKSLSLLCAALTWLRSHKREAFEASLKPADMGDEPDWVVEQMLRQRRAELAGRWERREARLAAARRREKVEANQARGDRNKRRRIDDGPRSRAKKAEDDEDAEFLLGDGDDSVGTGRPHDSDDRLLWFSAETRAMMEKAGLVAGKSTTTTDDANDDDLDDHVKIYYTSRTHSQLTQFIAELRRPTFPSSMPSAQSAKQADKHGDPSSSSSEPIKHVPLSSRQRLCINPAVARLGSVAAINDRCAELQKPKKAGDKEDAKGCKFIPSNNPGGALQFRDTTLATLPDIEDLYQLGSRLHVCPYYASRTAVPGAEIITLPYPLLLQKAAREALGIKLDRRNSIVIVDEAHNIMDAVASVHAAALRLSELRRARKLLEVYVRRFGKKLKGASRVMVGQLARVVQGLSAWLTTTLEASSSASGSGIVDPTALLKHKGADQINLFALVKYIQEAKLAYKVESYAAYVEDADEAGTPGTIEKEKSSPVLHTLSSFLLALTNLASEGRIFYEVFPSEGGQQKDIKLSYLLLSPTHAFSSIAADARAVILAGGTMAPFADYRTHLFPTHAPGKITTLSCGHVIPPENLCVWTLGGMKAGPNGGSGTVFDFSFSKRSQLPLVRDLGQAILNLCTVVPDGVVVFFPSYGYLDEVTKVWMASTDKSVPSMWDRLQTKKAVFRESRGASSDDVLAAYSKAILDPSKDTKQTGALLLSVVGGKMSEGINFADRLGRCVVIVGLPFPNLHSPDWKARMEYIETAETSEGGLDDEAGGAGTAGGSLGGKTTSVPASGRSSGSLRAREFYENACMRAVNQSIGRAIRHRNDYAAIVLCDHRFASPRIRSKLPGWIRGGMAAGSEEKGLAGMLGTMGQFFRSKRT
ncbi:ATP-dependent DNA helicase chl1 [Sporothrix stenoceras]|uniref:ATP-dependent DNA helicase CHL1 n=1 Tax=Sporothrix stenoceras TaxID=5173 RepID=A0ABR3YLX4_9PEZI